MCKISVQITSSLMAVPVVVSTVPFTNYALRNNSVDTRDNKVTVRNTLYSSLAGVDGSF